MSSFADKARETLAANRAAADKLARDKGIADTRRLLERAQRDLERRLREAEGIGGPGAGSFTAVQMRAVLRQIQHTVKELNPRLRQVLLSNGRTAAEQSAANTIRYLRDADRAFRGIGVQPLALNEARMMDAAAMGSESSILKRLASDPAHPANMGVLQRYGVSTIGLFEKELQVGLITKKPFAEMKADIVAKSPFLQGAPAHWAERIVRTELMAASNRGMWEANKEADDELGDIVKIIAAHFDDRTGADSFAVHGQIRRPTEAFEWWDGLYQHPPNRPNDREIMVTHRISWKIPEYLKWQSAGAITARWHHEGRKGSPPGRPNMTSVPLAQFGKPQKQPKKTDEEQELHDKVVSAYKTGDHEVQVT